MDNQLYSEGDSTAIILHFASLIDNSVLCTIRRWKPTATHNTKNNMRKTSSSQLSKIEVEYTILTLCVAFLCRPLPFFGAVRPRFGTA